MARTILYLIVPLLYLFFWAVYGFSGYGFYLETDPGMLTTDYQRLFVGQRTQLLSAELLFPLFMSLFFLTLFVLRLRPYFIRIPLLIAQFISLEFFVYRHYIFPDTLHGYQSASHSNMPLEYFSSPSYLPYLIPMVIGFVLLLVVRERKGSSWRDVLSQYS